MTLPSLCRRCVVVKFFNAYPIGAKAQLHVYMCACICVHVALVTMVTRASNAYALYAQTMASSSDTGSELRATGGALS